MSELQVCSTYGNACNTQTQTGAIYEQLRNGARYFDIRPTSYVDCWGSFTGWYTGHWAWVNGEDWQGCMGQSLDSVLDVTPNRLNERIAIQQGISLFPCNTKKPFESNLCAALRLPFDSLSSVNANSMQLKQLDENLKYEASVAKINLPRQFHKDAYLDLHRMNIDEASLFPGLDGFARSLKYHLRVMEP